MREPKGVLLEYMVDEVVGQESPTYCTSSNVPSRCVDDAGLAWRWYRDADRVWPAVGVWPSNPARAFPTGSS
jgi:hypothetical protein